MLMKQRKNKKGFTLIELVVVVAILAILAAVAVPSFIGLQATATANVLKADAATLAGQINVYNALGNTPVIDSATTAANVSTYLTNKSLLPALSSGNTIATALGACQWSGGTCVPK